VRVAIYFPSFSASATDRQAQERYIANFRRYISRCEELDFDIWCVDHLLTAPGLYGTSWMDPMSTLTYASALTSRVRLGTSISVAPLRNPVLLAKQIATLAQLSNDRFVFGTGPGWDAKTFDAVGVPLAERGSRTDEVIEAVRGLLTEDEFSFHGRHYNFSDVTIRPRPLTPPEVWVSGGAKMPDPKSPDKDYLPTSVLNRILKADGWISRAAGNQELLLRDMDVVKAAFGSAGVDAGSFTMAHCNFIHVSPGLTRQQALDAQQDLATRAFGTHRSYEHLQQCYLLGDLDHQLNRLRELAANGVDYFILGPLTDDLEQLDLIHEQIVPALMEAAVA
jgi:alkanesulfonate monooxygenase SsuD/methylene tetrahydromethanopterin reductase-like flavin-dependent oxidoreductase (luciferase family)